MMPPACATGVSPAAAPIPRAFTFPKLMEYGSNNGLPELPTVRPPVAVLTVSCTAFCTVSFGRARVTVSLAVVLPLRKRSKVTVHPNADNPVKDVAPLLSGRKTANPTFAELVTLFSPEARVVSPADEAPNAEN